MLPAGHLFGTNTTKLAIKKDAYLRAYTYFFIEQFSPTLNKKLVDQALSSTLSIEQEPNEYSI
jgi:LysR family cys regulon transcriptional activator